MSASSETSSSSCSGQSDQTDVNLVDLQASTPGIGVTAAYANVRAVELAIAQQRGLIRYQNLRRGLDNSVTIAHYYEELMAEGGYSLKRYRDLNRAIRLHQVRQNDLVTMTLEYLDTTGAFNVNRSCIPSRRRYMPETMDLAYIRGQLRILNAIMRRIGDKLAEIEGRELADLGEPAFVFPHIIRNEVDNNEDSGNEAGKDSDEQTDDETHFESDVDFNDEHE